MRLAGLVLALVGVGTAADTARETATAIMLANRNDLDPAELALRAAEPWLTASAPP